MGEEGSRVLRKRKRASEGRKEGLPAVLEVAAQAKNIVVFSGSGLSAQSGMSIFSTVGGLYERAQKRFKVSDGKKLFTWQFFEKRRLEVQAFFGDIYAEAQRATPASGHYALGRLAFMGKLLRHYTLNIDGLAEVAGLTTWHPESNPTGLTVEMHGNIKQLVCPSCHARIPITEPLLRQLRAKRRIRCRGCKDGVMRCCILLYDDAEDGAITPPDVFDVMEEDVGLADLILWVGISFEQSASTEYFRRVRRILQEVDRLHVCKQAIVNPSDEALWNLLSANNNRGDLDIMEVLGAADDVLAQVADSAGGGGNPLEEAAIPVPRDRAPNDGTQHMALKAPGGEGISALLQDRVLGDFASCVPQENPKMDSGSPRQVENSVVEADGRSPLQDGQFWCKSPTVLHQGPLSNGSSPGLEERPAGSNPGAPYEKGSADKDSAHPLSSQGLPQDLGPPVLQGEHVQEAVSLMAQGSMTVSASLPTMVGTGFTLQ